MSTLPSHYNPHLTPSLDPTTACASPLYPVAFHTYDVDDLKGDRGVGPKDPFVAEAIAAEQNLLADLLAVPSLKTPDNLRMYILELPSYLKVRSLWNSGGAVKIVEVDPYTFEFLGP